MKQNLNILIYGGGAVGLGIASCLLKTGLPVDILAREKTALALKTEGLLRDGIFGKVEISPRTFSVYAGLSEIPLKKQYRYIAVCTKSFDTLQAAKDLHSHPDLFSPETDIILFQNGWGNAELFHRFFQVDKIFSARVITGFTRPRPNSVTITVHAESVHVGNLKNPSLLHRIEPLCQAISEGGLPCVPFKEIGKDLWAKMLYNCPLNPLGAILGVPYGKLSESDYTKEIMNDVIREVFSVMKREGYTTHAETPDEFTGLFYSTLIPRTAEHESSMLQDLKAGKKSEIDALNGQVVELGMKHGCAVPVNRVMLGLIKSREKNR